MLEIAIDANGNTLTDASGKSYTWDFENRLTQAVVPGTGTTTFRYDPFGRRIQKSGPLGTTNYLYDGARLIEEADSSGNILARYAHSTEVDEPLSMLRGTVNSYYQNDGIGSITSLSNQTAALAGTYTFDSFGKLTASTGAITNPFRYTGREFDTETGIYYYRARYFDPGTGRFVSEDPIRFGGDGPDFYAYVNNDPTDFTDPLGLCCDVPAHPLDVSPEYNMAQSQANGYRWWFNTVGQWGGPWDYKNWVVRNIPNGTILETSTLVQLPARCISRYGSPCVVPVGQSKDERQTILTEAGGARGRTEMMPTSRTKSWRVGIGATTVARSLILRWVQRPSPGHHSLRR